MCAAVKQRWISIDEYLAGELISPAKHEYVDGTVYAMADANNRHNTLAGNIFAALHARLRGQPCRPFNSATKIRIRSATQTRFYYPDVLVTCLPSSDDDTFQDSPNLIVEVLSDESRRIDEVAKKDAYLSIPTLEVYMLVEPEEPRVVVYRRTDRGFVGEIVEGSSALIPLPFLGSDLALTEIYESE